MTFEKGTLILVDYTARVKDSDQVFETTSEAEAKKHSIHDAGIKYRPKLISVGDSWVLKGLDEGLADASVGGKLTIEVTPEKGFGVRDTKKVRMIPLRKLGDDAEKVSVGDSIEIDDKRGTIRFIGSGRVQIDYNHRFAGKTIVYEATVIKKLETDEDKAMGILGRHIPLDDSKLSATKTGSSLEVVIPSELFRAEGLQVIKHLIQVDMFKFIPELEEVRYIEVYPNKNAQSKKQPPAEAPKPAAS